MNTEHKIEIHKLWCVIRSLKKELKELSKKIDQLSPPKVEYDSDDEYDDEKNTIFNVHEDRYITL